MAQQVVTWKAKDGSSWETEELADLHDWITGGLSKEIEDYLKETTPDLSAKAATARMNVIREWEEHRARKRLEDRLLPGLEAGDEVKVTAGVKEKDPKPPAKTSGGAS